VGDGFLLMMIRPVGILTTTRFLSCSAHIAIERP
jgi:hypothetical protein